jgi:Transposase DDE domain group 1
VEPDRLVGHDDGVAVNVACRQPQVPCSFKYQTQSWNKPRRSVAMVEWHQRKLSCLKRPAKGRSGFYDGAAWRSSGQGNLALRWTPLSRRAFRNNAVRLPLFVLAYNLANFLRTLALPQEVEQWSLTTLREKLVKIGARIVRHGRYVVFQLAEVAVPRALFADILRRIDDLRPRPPPIPV